MRKYGTRHEDGKLVLIITPDRDDKSYYKERKELIAMSIVVTVASIVGFIVAVTIVDTESNIWLMFVAFPASPIMGCLWRENDHRHGFVV